MSRRHRIGVIGLLTAAALVLLARLAGLAPGAMADGSGPGDELWAAITAVESGGDAQAWSARGRSLGIAQIRPVCLADCNRIARLQCPDKRFALDDRLDPDKSREMWELYLAYYGQQYRRETGRSPTDEVYARIWNGGPTGWRKESTRGYWQRVRAVLEDKSPVAAAASILPGLS